MSDRRARAAAVLRAHGLDPDRLGPDALAAAAAQALLGGSDGAAIADALGECGDAGTGSTLTAVEAAVADRGARKAVRRALHRLRERGIAVPAPGPTVAHPAVAAEPQREAWLSAVDGNGTRLAWLVAALPSGALSLAAAELNEPAGLTDLRTTEVSRKQLRTARQHLRESGVPLVAAPFEIVDALLVEGQQRRGGAVDRKLDWLRIRPRFTAATPLAPAEPRSPRVAAPAGDEIDALVAGSASLLAEPELSRWWPEPAGAEPFLREIDEVEDSPIVLSPQQQEERLAAALARAADALYPPPVVARRLAATAYVFAETGRPGAARTALAVAAVLERAPRGVGDVPLVAALTNQGLGRLAAARAAERRAARQSSLVVTPGEALRDRSPGRRERTRS